MGGSKKTSGKGKGKSDKSKSKKGSEVSSKKEKKNVDEDETNTKTGEARFNFLNRDVYEGAFKITTVPQNYICRQGAGTYKTADNQAYVGEWDKDILKGEVEITYKDGSKYVGYVEDMKYTGNGRYEFPDSSATTCTFIADRPIGEMALIDPTGHEWRGLAGPTGASFIPINRFLPTASALTPSNFMGNLESPTLKGSRASMMAMRRSSKAVRTSSHRRASVAHKSPFSSPQPSPPRSPPSKK